MLPTGNKNACLRAAGQNNQKSNIERPRRPLAIVVSTNLASISSNLDDTFNSSNGWKFALVA